MNFKHKSNLLIIAGVFFLGIFVQQLIIKDNLKLYVQNGNLNVALGQKATPTKTPTQQIDLKKLQAEVFPQNGYVFKIKWGDLGKRMVADGVIDETKLTQVITGDKPLPLELKKYLDGSAEDLELNQNNAQFWVDVLWGLGLANKNELLDTGPMVESGQTANFASTGGYTIGKSDSMNYYSKYSYIKLTPEQQIKVKEIAGNIYRPCCNNSTAFPDCNHGMAALALVALMVSQDFSEDEIYKTVLAFNSYWFPQTYLDISYHFAKNNREYKAVPAKEILSKTFSSSSGYKVISNQIGPVAWPNSSGRSSCGA
ncbi:MAG: hypothetical protein Q7R43_01525 [Candidatus Daviesbacteria bacterium]|nr:hypothetical protein [Candidatus Daviesbacteria bacterium]